MFKAGDSLIIETNVREGGQKMAHLHFVLLDPDLDTERTIIVNVETLSDNKQDHTVVLGPGDHHSFITHESYVNYRRARIVTVTKLRELVDRGTAKCHEPLAPGVLARVRSGLERSGHTPEEVLEFFKDHLFKQAGLGHPQLTRKRGK